MSDGEFLHNMGAAQALLPVGDYASFISGYMKGLKCHFHGEAFAAKKEHGYFMTLKNDPDTDKAAFGRGYRAGFAGKRIGDILPDLESD